MTWLAVCAAITTLAPAPEPLKGDALLDELQHRAVNFFWQESHPDTGFTKDRAANLKDKDDYTVSSCASTGFALAAYPIGVERKWLDREKALTRTRTTLKSLLTLHDGKNGWYYHFVDWKTGKRMWNCELSTIDTSILLAGVIIAQQYWKDGIVDTCAKTILNRVDWEWFLRDTSGKAGHEFFNMGYKPEVLARGGFIPATWAAYNELMMLYIQAYGASPKIRTDGFRKFKRDVYTYDGIEHIEGGPLFMHQMSHVFYDFSNKRDEQGFNYFVATINETRVNRKFCIDNPKGWKSYGPDYWGLSASDGPKGYQVAGTPPRPENNNGTITPTSPIASLLYTPRESLDFAESLYASHPKAWGRYGFSNGICDQEGWIGPDALGIDTGMMLLGIENARTGLPHRLSMSHPAIQKGFERCGFRPAPGSDVGPLRVSG